MGSRFRGDLTRAPEADAGASAMVKWAVIVAVALLLVVAVALLGLSWLVNSRAFTAQIAQTVSRALGRPVKVASMSITVLPRPSVRLAGLQVAEDPAFGADPFLTVSEGRMSIRLRPLLSRRLELADLTVLAPTIHLVEDGRGRWNWTSLGLPAPGTPTASRSGGRGAIPAAGAVALSHIRIVDGSLRYERLAGGGPPPLRVERINITASHAAGPALRLEGEALVEPGGVRLTFADASLTPGAARSMADAGLRATVVVDAPDVALLGHAIVPSPAVAGALKGRLEVSGTGARPVASGTLGLDRLVLAEERASCAPPHRQLTLSDVRIPLAYAGARLDSAPLEARLASGSVSGRLAVAFGPAPTVTLTGIAVKGVQLGPILVDFLCHPYAVTGPLDLAGEATVRAADPWGTASGSGRLRVGPGELVGDDVARLIHETLAVTGVASARQRPDRGVPAGPPLAFDSVTATYTISHGVARTDDLLYRSADVRISAAGTYALASGRLDMDVTLIQGANEIRGVVSGTPGALRMVPTGARVQDRSAIKRLLDRLSR